MPSALPFTLNSKQSVNVCERMGLFKTKAILSTKVKLNLDCGDVDNK